MWKEFSLWQRHKEAAATAAATATAIAALGHELWCKKRFFVCTKKVQSFSIGGEATQEKNSKA